MDQNPKKPTNKREAILRAAVDIFCDKGFYDAKIEEIAERAGIGKGTIYEYFESKEVLFENSIRSGMEAINSIVEQEVFSKSTPKEQIESLIKENLRILYGFKNLAKLMSFDLMHPEKFKAYANKDLFTKRLDVAMEIILRGKEEGDFKDVNAYVAASMIYFCIMAMAYTMIFSPPEAPAFGTDISEDVVGLIMNGLIKIHD